jgi:hypothetical protein
MKRSSKEQFSPVGQLQEGSPAKNTFDRPVSNCNARLNAEG